MLKKPLKKKRILKRKSKNRQPADEFIEFVTMFNRFINHQPKKRIHITEKDMRM